MRVFLTGGTGLIGRRLVRKLLDRGDRPVILSRDAYKARLSPSLRGVEVVQGDPTVSGGWEVAVDGSDAVVNLAGHNLFAERWDDAVKRKIRDSRVLGTENVVAAIGKAARKPKVLVQASATGFYGPSAGKDLTEQSAPGIDFLARVCRDWEEASAPAESFGVRVPIIRTGVVLDRDGGALKIMTPIFKYLPGGAAPVGGASSPFLPANGSEWMSWIHRDDIVGIFLTALDNPEAGGPINGVAPEPVRNKDFARTLARVLRRGFWPPYVPFGPPDAVLRLILGEVAQVVTDSQLVLPKKAQSLGYAFQFPDLLSALQDLLGKPKTAVLERPKEVKVGAEAGV